MTLRNRLRSWHRDLGYFFSGITIVFAVSGVAVNHIDDWNPNYDITPQEGKIPAIYADKNAVTPEKLTRRLDIPDKVTGYIHTGPETIRIFLGKNVLDVDWQTGVYRYEKVRERVLLHAFNRLHLNELKNNWVWFSDIFAIVLLFLALSGLVINRGRKGFKARGVWLFGLGLIIPALFLSGLVS